MLKRVVIDNYKVFSNKQVVDFTVDTTLRSNSKYFTLVGENGCGKSTFLALVGLASDFGGRVSRHICDSSRESMVACEYDVEKWTELSYLEYNNLSSIHPALELWFLSGILKIPKEVQQFLLEKHPGLGTEPLTLVIGFKNSPSPDGMGGGIVYKFLYVNCAGQIIALLQPLNANAEMVAVDSSVTRDLLHWSPDPAHLVPTHCNFIRSSTPVYDSSNIFPGRKPKHPQAEVILALRNTRLPIESRDVIWDEVIALFHQLTGDTKITVVYDAATDSIHMRQQFGKHVSIRDDLPEGFFHAFIMAFLVVSPLAQTVLLDEPTAGMHPLQIRRLQRILSQKSFEKDKVIVIATHAPDMVDTSRINRIFRFQRLDSGYAEIRRVSPGHGFRDIRFISSVEGRELFFTRRIIWVEGDTDRRFCDAVLKLIDDGDEVVWDVLLDPKDQRDPVGLQRTPGAEYMMEEEMDDEEYSSTEEIDYGNTDINPLDNLFASPAYERIFFRASDLSQCQQLVRSCSVLSLSGKKNIDKATRICKDLGIPYAVICDLDAILPNSKRNPIKKQFINCVGYWFNSRVDKKLIFDAEQSPASACVNELEHKAQLKACRYAQEVMDFYETKQKIFAWRVGNGEIEDLVRVTKTKFAKKWWADYTFEAFQDLIKAMLIPSNADSHHFKERSNPELLRCFYFILHFLQDIA